ncbi:ead/Ea22-like family protein [Escherichia coli]|nr:ead/Ea22-like family protein [Escherichia coli]
MRKINYQALREIAKQATQGEWVAFISPGKHGTYAVHTPGDNHHGDIVDWPGFDEQKNAENNARYIAAFNPEVVQALLDERERNQQYIKRRDQENEDIALTVGKLRVELEETKSKLNEQRKYYEGVISDGSKRIAELEAREIKPEDELSNIVLFPVKEDDPRNQVNFLYEPSERPYCHHASVRVDEKERQVRCKICGAVVEPFDWMLSVAKRETRLADDVKLLRQEEQERRKNIEKLIQIERNAKARIRRVTKSRTE